MNLDIPILGSDTLDNNTVLEAAQGSSIELIVTTFYNEGGDPEFDEGFKAWINADSENLTNNGGNDMIAAVSVMGYDAYNVAVDAIERAQSTDPNAIYEALKSTNWGGHHRQHPVRRRGRRDTRPRLHKDCRYRQQHLDQRRHPDRRRVSFQAANND